MKFTIHENFNDMSLEDILKTLHLPKKELHLLRMSKDITINEDNMPLNTVVHTGDTVVLPAEDEKSQYKPSYRTCEVLYEDRYLALLFKPRGVKTHPNQMPGRKSNRLVERPDYRSGCLDRHETVYGPVYSHRDGLMVGQRDGL